MHAVDAVLNPALADATRDFEKSAVAPRWVPGVLDQPVRHRVLHAPAHELDGMAARHLAGLVLVDAGLVGFEVGVDGEGDRLLVYLNFLY